MGVKLTSKSLSETGRCVEDHFGKETAHAAPPLGPAQNKKSLRTGSEGAGGREGLLTSRENAFLGLKSILDHFQRWKDICLWQKRQPSAPNLERSCARLYSLSV